MGHLQQDLDLGLYPLYDTSRHPNHTFVVTDGHKRTYARILSDHIYFVKLY